MARYLVYANEDLDRALDARISKGRGKDENGLRSRSSLITAMVDRYHETCRRYLPTLTLAEWAMIFDALKGCWLLDGAGRAAAGLAMEIADAATLNRTDAKWGVANGLALALRIEGMDFATRIAIVDAAERFWALDVQADGTLATDTDPFACWRAPIRAVVGRLADDPPVAPDGRD